MLATLSTVELEEQLNRDTMRLKKIAEGMDVLRAEADALHQRIVARQNKVEVRIICQTKAARSAIYLYATLPEGFASSVTGLHRLQESARRDLARSLLLLATAQQ